jgi:transglutaminase-like putative cysteine protease
MKLHVVHRTIYRYGGAVTQNLNEIRLKPMSADGQVCDSFNLTTRPASRLSSFLDFYFNYVQCFEIGEPHHELAIETVSTVTTQARLLPRDAITSPITRLPECHLLERCYDFTQPSTLVAVSPEVWRLAVDTCHGMTDIWQSAVAIMRFIHSGFRYVPNATNVTTHMSEVLQQRRGVCQDFAHVMLGMCRAIKIPARYVSGYIYNGHTSHLIGSQASHAWCEVFLPDLGWHGLDPTNNQPADDRYIKVAVGRDYADAAPVKGHFRGASKCEMKVEVEVSQLPP